MFSLKGTYHAKCTFVCLLYMNMCPRCVRELTKCQKTQPSLFSFIPKSLKTGLQRSWYRSEIVLTSETGSSAYMGNSPPIRGMGGWATAIAAWKRWRRCSTYARPVSGAVVCHKSSEEDFSQNQPLQKQGWKRANRVQWGMAKMHDLFGILKKELHRHVLYRYGPTIYYSNIAW